MDELDGAILDSLRQLGCDIPQEITRFSEVTPKVLVYSVAFSLDLLYQHDEQGSSDAPALLESLHEMKELPTSRAAMFRLSHRLGECLRAAGFTGAIGYQMFLYPTGRDTRRMLMWLCDAAPSVEEDETRAEVTEAPQRDEDFSDSDEELPDAADAAVDEADEADVQVAVAAARARLARFCAEEIQDVLTVSDDIAEMKEQLLQQQQQQQQEKQQVDPEKQQNEQEEQQEPQKSEAETEEEKMALRHEVETLETQLQEVLAQSDAAQSEKRRLETVAATDLVPTLRTARRTLKLLQQVDTSEETEKLAQLRENYVKLKGANVELEQATEQRRVTWEQKQTSAATELQRLRDYNSKMQREMAKLVAKAKNDATQLQKQQQKREETIASAKSILRTLKSHDRVNEEFGKAMQTRSQFVARLSEVVKNCDRQRAAGQKVAEDVRQVQRSIGALTQTANRAFAVVDELCFSAAQKNTGYVEAYGIIVRLRTVFEKLVATVREIGASKSEARSLEMSARKLAELNIEQALQEVQQDTALVRQENDRVAEAIRVVKTALA